MSILLKNTAKYLSMNKNYSIFSIISNKDVNSSKYHILLNFVLLNKNHIDS